MGADSKIQWTDHTFNPWIGCTKVSPGCTNCYAEAYDKRVGGGSFTEEFDGNPGVVVQRYKRLRWGKGAPRTRTSEANWRKPLKWNREAEAAGVRRRVFCASLADVFDPEVPDQWRFDLFDLIRKTPQLDWLLLTKRPEHTRPMIWAARDIAPPVFASEAGTTANMLHRWANDAPPPNVWLGVTVENQEQAEKRIPLLLAQKATVRFLSMEPLLGPVDLKHLPWRRCRACGGALNAEGCGPGHEQAHVGIDWAIIGGESGPKARPFDVAWARSLVKQCRAAGVAPFVKQLGAHPCEEFNGSGQSYHHTHGDLLCKKLRDSHGGDPSEWPADLRVREFPEVRR